MSGRKTIAVLSDYLSFITEGFEGRLRQTLHAASRERDVDLLLVYGRALHEPQPSCAAHNSIFDLVDRERVDGVILLSSLLSSACGAERFREFARRYANIPCCSLGIAMAGVPSVEIDNRPGMQALMEHLIADHGCKRLAYIDGQEDHPDAKLRRSVYHEVLQRHGLEADPRLLARGDFVRHLGHDAMLELLARDLEMDAVVCANDAMATGAIAALRRSGRRVPTDLKITGFDDLLYARLANPPLTTVAQPLEALAEFGLELVLEQMEGRSVPLENVLSTKVVVRRSCGCGREASASRAALTTQPTALEYVRARRAEIAARIVAFLPPPPDAGALTRAEELVAALERELTGNAQSLSDAVEDTLEGPASNGERYRALHDALHWLREELDGLAGAPAPALWHELDQRIVMASTAALFKQRLDLDYNYMQLVGSGEESVSFELSTLEDSLNRYLPGAGVGSAFLSRFTDTTQRELDPFVRLLDGELLRTPALPFRSKNLFPPDVDLGRRARTFVVIPLVFKTRCLGVAVFEYTEGLIGYRMLADHAAAALESTLLHREVVYKTMLHERSIQERLAANQRMQSLRVLAGGVAHDLNNALGPLVALPDLMLQQLEAAPAIMQDFRADVESIKSATLRAAQTVKDLLTLSRQGRTPKTPIDVNRVLQACLSGDALRFIPASKRGIRVILELYGDELPVIASETHVMRAVTNLVNNGIDAISVQGRIVVRSFPAHLTQPHLGYETIPPGDYVVVSVSDTGAGIATNALPRLFEPFFSTKTLADRSGTGLGLAIVHGVVKEHEGFIDVATSAGRGTNFSLYFPRAADDTTLPADELPASAVPGRAKILVIDDDPSQLRTARRVLTHYGYDVDTSTTAQQACEWFERALTSEAAYDLVIVDMQLAAEDDGLSVLERLRARVPAQKGIIVSGHAADDRVELAAAQGIPWLQKPYAADALATAVRAAIAGRPSIPVLRVSSRPPRDG